MIIKELLFILSFIAAAMISRVEYNEFIIGIQSGNPAILVNLIPNMFTLILGSFIVYLVLYTLFRWWVWSGYSTVKWNFLLTNTLMVIPFTMLTIVLLALSVLALQVYSAVWNGYVRIFALFTWSLLVYYAGGCLMAYVQGRNMLGKNPWYNVYDALTLLFTKQSLQLCLVYTVPALASLLAVFNWLSPAWIPIITWGSYLFARQYIVSKKHTLKAYTHDLWVLYSKRCKTVYKKVFRG